MPEQVSTDRTLGRLEEAVTRLRSDLEDHRIEDRNALASISEGIAAIKLRLGIEEALDDREEAVADKTDTRRENGRTRWHNAWSLVTSAVVAGIVSWFAGFIHH